MMAECTIIRDKRDHRVRATKCVKGKTNESDWTSALEGGISDRCRDNDIDVDDALTRLADAIARTAP